MRKSKKEPMLVTSFRLPADVKAFLDRKALEQARTKSWVLVDFLRRWMHYETEQAKQPKVKK